MSDYLRDYIVYVAHPYTGDTERNVERARMLANKLNALGYATISPLQESYGREHVMSEALWLEHGLVVLSRCDIVVIPQGAEHTSAGCHAELDLAKRLRILIWRATWIDGDWALERYCEPTI